ncbi:MAG: hypothetical protein EXS50_03655 [Candidatus Taylorbacteria bacterium]|nr:hypothetical protein [Candidatus Taylorbacteria bacterium]
MITKKIIVALAISLALPVFAQTGSTTPKEVRPDAKEKMPKEQMRGNASAEKMTQMKSKANQEIDRRVEGLNKLSAKVAEMKKLTESQKASIASSITIQISALTQLKAKIEADTDIETLKADVKSVTEAYRIYALVLPQIEVVAAVDRLGSLIDTATTLGAKLQEQINQGVAAGKDVTTAQSHLTDYNSRIADATIQAQSAITTVASLVPDQGDKTKMQSNTQALKEARTKIKTAQQDLQNARQSVEKIKQAFKGNKPKMGSTTPATAR